MGTSGIPNCLSAVISLFLWCPAATDDSSVFVVGTVLYRNVGNILSLQR